MGVCQIITCKQFNPRRKHSTVMGGLNPKISHYLDIHFLVDVCALIEEQTDVEFPSFSCLGCGACPTVLENGWSKDG